MQAAVKFLKEDSKSNEDRRDVYEPDFVPYACHYDQHTILTKNGELLQTIRVTGHLTDQIKNKRVNLRDAVRSAISANLPDDNYALWIHTIRRREDMTPAGEFPDNLSKILNDKWSEHNEWNNRFVNELYITIVRDGQKINVLKDPREFFTVLWPPAHRKMRFGFLEKIHKELDAVTGRVLEALQPFGAERLAIKERDGVYNSEIIEFIGKIINLGESALAIPVVDLSEYLPSKDISFGYNVMEVRGMERRSFGAVLTIKEYKDLPQQSLDTLMQLPQEFILCQCVDFINAASVKEQYKEQKHVIDLSGDESLSELSGLKDVLTSDKGRKIDYGQHQMSMLLFGNSIAALEASVENADRALSNLGIVHVREDIMLEEAYWSLLPGNFVFVERHAPINIGRIAGFTALQAPPSGIGGSKWGPPVTMFNQATGGMPYFFNFHSGDNGHTAIISPPGINKTLMLNFLCAQAQKLNPRIFFLDEMRESQIFIRAMGGKYQAVGDDKSPNMLSINPLHLDNTPENLNFLLEWVWSLVTHDGNSIDENELTVLQSALADLMSQPKESRTLARLAEMLTSGNMHNMATWLSSWFGSGRFAGVFNHQSDDLDLSDNICAIDMTLALKSGYHVPVLLYFLYRVLQRLDGTPTILVMNEAWRLLDNDVFAPKISALLDIMREHNTVIIAAASDPEKASKSPISAELMKGMATSIFFPGRDSDGDYKSAFMLSDREFRLLGRMQQDKKYFLLKHDGEAIAAEFELYDISEAIFGLLTDSHRLKIMDQVTKELGDDPADWVEAYLKICEHEMGALGA